MAYDDSQRGKGHDRRTMSQRYAEKAAGFNGNYSPSSNYHYNSSNSSGNNYQGGGHQQQHPRRRTDRFRRETINYSEKLVKQNEIIIQILKEIRDRLQATGTFPPASYDEPQHSYSIDGEIEPSIITDNELPEEDFVDNDK